MLAGKLGVVAGSLVEEDYHSNSLSESLDFWLVLYRHHIVVVDWEVSEGFVVAAVDWELADCFVGWEVAEGLVVGIGVVTYLLRFPFINLRERDEFCSINYT